MASDAGRTSERVVLLEEQVKELRNQVDGLQNQIASLRKEVRNGSDRYVTKESVKAARAVGGVLLVAIVALLGILWRLQVESLEAKIDTAKSNPADLAREIVREIQEIQGFDLSQPRSFSQAEQHYVDQNRIGTEAPTVVPESAEEELDEERAGGSG